MRDQNKTKKQLIEELGGLRQRMTELERLANEGVQIEKALQEGETRYRTLVEESFDGIFVQKGTKIIFANRRLHEMLDYGKSQLEGLNHWLIYHPDYQRLTRKRAQERMRGGKVLSQYEVKLQRKDGSSFDGEINARAIMFGKEPGIQVWVRDITQRKQAEEKLKESEEKYRILVQKSLQGLLIAQGVPPRLVFVNPAMAKMLGYTFEEITSLSPEEIEGLIYYKDREIFFKNYKILLEEGTILPHNEVRGIRKDGTVVWLELSAIRIEYKGQLTVQATFIDITERKRAEKALRESEAKYRNILENIAEGYYEVNLAGNFTFFNQSVCQMIGYTREELLGMNDRNFTDQENAKKLYHAFNSVYQTGEPVRGFDWEIIRKDGTKRLVEASVSLIKDPGGQPTGFRGIVRDITEQKRAEQAMSALQEELRQSQKMEAIGRLAGGIAHDFNNLLTVISGNCQLSLLDLREGDPLRENIEEIGIAADRATSLTRQLLAFGRRQILKFRVLDLNTILYNLDKMLRRVIGEDIELITLLKGDLGKVKTDPGQIEQVILNLAVNARDAMPNGGKLIIETENIELDEEYAHAHIGVKPGLYVRLSVSDTGLGMSSEVKEHIFEPFFTTKKNGEGSGLGLSTVYGIISQSGGDIWVYSELGHGTTFKVYLPRVDEPVEALGEKIEEREAPRGRETILFVEDEESVRKLAVQFLKRQGYRVLEASHGGDALLICKKFKDPIRLMVTDVVMPGMNGRELAENLLPLRSEMKVLYISGYTDNAIVQHGILEPGMPFLQKPFTMEVLARKVREILDATDSPT